MDGERGAESAETKAARGAGGVNLREACNWPTPRAEDSEQTGPHGTAADTPSAQDAKNLTLPASQTNRDSVVGQLLRDASSTSGKPRDWPTATADRGMGSGTNGTKAINDAMGTPGEKRNYKGSLNSAWVAQLMGYPDGWLDISTEKASALSATRKSRSASR